MPLIFKKKEREKNMRKEKILKKLKLNKFPENLQESINYILVQEQCSERDIQIFNEYYFDEMTLKDIGEKHNLSGTGANAVVSKICRVLVKPCYRRFLINGVHYKQEKIGLKSSVADLDLTNRSFICLYRAGIYTIEDLINLDFNQLQHIRNMSKKSLAEIVEKLNKNGFYLNVISS